MDKICIVKRRKQLGEPTRRDTEGMTERVLDQPEVTDISCSFINGASGVRIQNPGPSPTPGNIDQRLSIQLNPLNARAAERCSPLPSAESYSPEIVTGDHEGRYVFNFLFKKVHDVRLLSPKDVCVMLKVSRRFLAKLVSSGKIESYKLGRLRRFLLDDILTYLGENKVTPAMARPTQVRRIDQGD
mgnify:CR=1 FL=1